MRIDGILTEYEKAPVEQLGLSAFCFRLNLFCISEDTFG